MDTIRKTIMTHFGGLWNWALLLYYGRTETAMRAERTLCERRIADLETALRQEYRYREQLDGALSEVEARTSSTQLSEALRTSEIAA